MKKIAIIILFLFVLGCNSNIKPNQEILNSTNSIRGDADYIKTETKSETIKGRAKNIISEAKNIEKNNIDVSKDIEQLKKERQCYTKDS